MSNGIHRLNLMGMRLNLAPCGKKGSNSKPKVTNLPNTWLGGLLTLMLRRASDVSSQNSHNAEVGKTTATYHNGEKCTVGYDHWKLRNSMKLTIQRTNILLSSAMALPSPFLLSPCFFDKAARLATS